MLVQVAVQNFKSIEEEVILQMSASSVAAHPSHKVKTKFGSPKELLRLGALYGANASGKTNFIQAVALAKNLIVDGTHHGEHISAAQPFRLSNAWRNKPTSVEFVIYLEDQLYTYGFSVTPDRVVEEWLFAQQPGAKERRLFERVTEDDHAVVKTGRSLETEDYPPKMLNMVARSTRVNQLYLHELLQKNHPGIRPVTDWFKKCLTIIPAVSQYRNLTTRAVEDVKFTDLISTVLKKVGTGIERVEPHPRKVNLEHDLYIYPKPLQKELYHKLSEIENNQRIFVSSEEFQRVYKKEKGEVWEYQLVAVYRDKDGKEVKFPIEEESDGTRRLLHLCPLLVDVKYESKVVFIDELDRRLHPLLSRTLVSLFDEIKPEGNRSQLVFTTHDTNLFDQSLLRRDELWLMEKNRYGATQLRSLHEFKIRNDKKLDKGYLLGRFGGIPKIGHEILEPDG